MSTFVADHLPAGLARLFASEERERAEGQCFILVTADQDYTPRPCLLSIGEILLIDDRHMRIAVWPDSRTTANLQRGNPVLMTCALPPDTFHIRARPRPLPPAPANDLVRFELEVSSVERDGHEGMPVTQPMWFAARDNLRETVREMWRNQVDALCH